MCLSAHEAHHGASALVHAKGARRGIEAGTFEMRKKRLNSRGPVPGTPVDGLANADGRAPVPAQRLFLASFRPNLAHLSFPIVTVDLVANVRIIIGIFLITTGLTVVIRISLSGPVLLPVRPTARVVELLGKRRPEAHELVLHL